LTTNFRLSRVAANDFANAAGEWGLLLSDFDWSSNEHGSHLLTHRPTGATFTFDRVQDGFWCSYWPDVEEIDANAERLASWGEVVEMGRRWTRAVAIENATPDLWALASAQREVIAPGVTGDNSPFTPDEQVNVKAAISEIAQHLAESERLQGDTLTSVRALENYAREAAERTGRLDFKNVLASVLLQMALESGLTSEASRALFVFAAAAFAKAAVGLLGP
jgi:hypothetical protein